MPARSRVSGARGSRPSSSALNCAALTSPGQAELVGAGAGPLAGRLAATRVVVVPALGDLLLVVALLAQRELPNRQHERKLAKSSSLGDTVCGAERSWEVGWCAEGGRGVGV